MKANIKTKGRTKYLRKVVHIYINYIIGLIMIVNEVFMEENHWSFPFLNGCC